MLAFFLEIRMHLIEVEILGQVITSQYGTLKTGDILRTDAAFAKHLVEDCAAAKYVNAPAKKSAEVSTSAVVSKSKKK